MQEQLDSGLFCIKMMTSSSSIFEISNEPHGGLCIYDQYEMY